MFAFRLLIVLVCAAFISSASGNQGSPTFTILKPPEPAFYRVANSQFGFGALVHGIRNSALSSNFSEDMRKIDPKLNEYLRREITSVLLADSWGEVNPPEYSFNLSDLWTVDYKSLQTSANVVIHAYIHSVGVVSRSTSLQYQPFIYVNYCLAYFESARICKVENTIVFGDGTKKDGDLVYFAPEVYRWDSAEQVFTSQEAIVLAFKYGLKRIAQDIAGQALNNFPVKTSVPISAPSAQTVSDRGEIKEPVVAKLPKPKESMEQVRDDPRTTDINATEESPAKISPDSDIAAKMRTLDKLHKEGLITNQEYEAKKKEILQRL